MTKYHINPKTGNPNICHAENDRCPFGSADNHFDSKVEARTVFEKNQERIENAKHGVKQLKKIIIRNNDLDFDAISFELDAILKWEEDWTKNDFHNLELVQKITAVTEREPFTAEADEIAEKLVKQLIPAKTNPRQPGSWSSTDTSWRARDKMLNTLGENLLKRRRFDQLTHEPAEEITNDRLMGYQEAQEKLLHSVNHPPYNSYKGAVLGSVEDHFQEAIGRVIRGDEAIDEDDLTGSDDISLLPPTERIFNTLHPRSKVFNSQLYLGAVFPVNELKKEMDRVGLDGVSVTTFQNGREWGNVYTVVDPSGETRSFSVYEHRNTDSIIINGQKNWNGDDLPYSGTSKNSFFAEFAPEDHQRAAQALTFYLASAQQGTLEDDNELSFKSSRRDWDAILSESIPGFKEWKKKHMPANEKTYTSPEEEILARLDF